MNRRAIAILILLAWMGTLGWLGSRSIRRGETRDTSPRNLSPDAAFFAILVGTEQVGVANIYTDTIPTGFLANQIVTIDVQTGGSTWRIGSRNQALLSRGLDLVSYESSANEGGQSERLAGAVSRDTLRVQSALAVDSPFRRSRLGLVADRPTLGFALPYRMAFSGRLAPGRSMAAASLDPASGEARLTRVTAGADSIFVVTDSARYDSIVGRWVPAQTLEIRAWRLAHADPGLPVTVWTDSRGMVVRLDHALGITLQRTAFEIARNNYNADRSARGPGLLNPPAARPLMGSGVRPDTSRGRVVLRLARTDGPAPEAVLAGLSGGRQTVHGDTVVISRATTGAADQVPTGYEVGVDWPGFTATDPAPPRDLSPVEQVRFLARWVAREIKPDTSFTAPLALEDVLALRRAGADGKARLFVAMVRSLGIPARVVTGLAAAPRAALLGHAWAEVWFDGWVAVDPTVGDMPASAGLLRLREGGRSRPADLVPLVAALRIEWLSEPGRP